MDSSVRVFPAQWKSGAGLLTLEIFRSGRMRQDASSCVKMLQSWRQHIAHEVHAMEKTKWPVSIVPVFTQDVNGIAEADLG